MSIPARSIISKPLQKPRPPLWMAATRPQSWEIAGRDGIGILGLTIFVSVPQLAERVRTYRQALTQATPVGKFINDRVGAFTIVHVADAQAQAIANGGADAAINYLRYAFRVLGGFADPGAQGMQRDAGALEIKSTPYRDLIAKEHPLIVKMQKNECTFDDLEGPGLCRVLSDRGTEYCGLPDRHEHEVSRALHLVWNEASSYSSSRTCPSA